jgi:hypothetical protein
MATSAIAKGLTQLLARNVGARITTSFKPATFPSETIDQPLKLRKFAEKQAEQLGPEDAAKIIGEGEAGLPLLLYHRVTRGSEPFQKFKGKLEPDTPAYYDFISTGLSKKGMANWTEQLDNVPMGHLKWDDIVDVGDSGERVAIGMGKVNKLFDHNNPDHVNDLFKQLRKNLIDERTEAKNRGLDSKYSEIQDMLKGLKKRKELIKRGGWLQIEDYDVQEALKDLGYDAFTTIESGKNVMLFNPNEQFIPLFDPLKKSAIGFSRGGGLSNLNEKV